MKNIKIGLGIGMLALMAITSCKKLELTPFTTIPTEDAFETVRDAQTWNNGVYAAFRGRQYGPFTITQDVQSDQLNASLSYGNRNGASTVGEIHSRQMRHRINGHPTTVL